MRCCLTCSDCKVCLHRLQHKLLIGIVSGLRLIKRYSCLSRFRLLLCHKPVICFFFGLSCCKLSLKFFFGEFPCLPAAVFFFLYGLHPVSNAHLAVYLLISSIITVVTIILTVFVSLILDTAKVIIHK